MGASQQRQALTALKTALEGITTGSGYANTIALVENVARDWETAQQQGALPHIGILPAAVTVQNYMGPCMRVALVTHLTVHARANTVLEGYDTIESLIDDIIAAIGADVTLGGTCTNTTITGWQTDQGDPDKMDHRGGTVSARVDLQIIYHRDVTIS